MFTIFGYITATKNITAVTSYIRKYKSINELGIIVQGYGVK